MNDLINSVFVTNENNGYLITWSEEWQMTFNVDKCAV